MSGLIIWQWAFLALLQSKGAQAQDQQNTTLCGTSDFYNSTDPSIPYACECREGRSDGSLPIPLQSTTMRGARMVMHGVQGISMGTPVSQSGMVGVTFLSHTNGKAMLRP